MTLDDKTQEEYNKRFGRWEREKLEAISCSPEKAGRYNTRFDAEDISFLFKAGCTPKQSRSYDSRFGGQEIAELFKAGCKPETADKYNKRFSGLSIASLFEAGITPETANHYNQRFNRWEIQRLFKAGCKPEIANKYNTRFNEANILLVFNLKCFPETANQYPERFEGWEIETVFQAGCKPEIANKYNARFNGREIDKLFRVHCSPQKADEYNTRFDGAEIADLFDVHCSPQKADEYNTRFDGAEIADLFNAKCTPEITNKYYKKVEGGAIYLFYLMGIRPDNTSIEKQKKLYDVLYKLAWRVSGCIDPKEYTLLGTGSLSVVLLKNDKPTAWKFSKTIEQEYNLLRKIKINNSHLKNVIELKGEPIEGIALELEYINGKTLQQIMEEQKTLLSDKVLKYSADLANGIAELRQAGIYHRDLHDRNILIDQKKDRAVIIDLGAATENPKETHQLNRAYGGNNDLISLGQLMYKMATGHNLFSEEAGFTCYSEVKKGIKTKREGTYDNSKLKQNMLNKVKKDVKNKNLASIVVTLLDDDLWTQPSLYRVKQAKELFERYSKPAQQSQSNP